MSTGVGPAKIKSPRKYDKKVIVPHKVTYLLTYFTYFLTYFLIFLLTYLLTYLLTFRPLETVENYRLGHDH